MPHFGAWVTFAERDDLDKLVGMIATGRVASTVEPAADVAAVIESLPPGSRVLDLGCGVCRNAADYAIRFPHLELVGYDSPQMLSRVGEFIQHRYGRGHIDNLVLCGDWQRLSAERFSCIYATLVFQHVQPGDICEYLRDIKKMTPLLVVHGRRGNDHCSGGTWRVIESCGLVPANAAAIGYAPDGPDEEHLPPCIYEID